MRVEVVSLSSAGYSSRTSVGLPLPSGRARQSEMSQGKNAGARQMIEGVPLEDGPSLGTFRARSWLSGYTIS
jgi:hypothetical protein